ncbi:FadR/GntR family transcriptional regulator [Diaphorobacter sp. C33]|uniref:GntR family transcriptional regulator n=1 Tax=Diaphorobacter nitroreducens TaxID=164759 RepID=A0AAX1WR77_9BURK|nr:FadR/GntR family transcriptional regulator [Diaphorobacter sp. C33]ROR39749.1 GntR family transcriptional regulator [Diaphorobacter nitroreducens]WKK90647.1 FadR/GntR family transcriptional regulator [Diaphorobacter sp. C33]
MNTPSTGLPESIASVAQHASSLRGRAGRSAGRSLAKVLFDEFESKIRQGLLREGDKLPTESELVQGYDVSRTVVREALSKLQAAGMVETRHGIGTFVLPPRSGGMFFLDPSELAESVDVLAVLELRISLETESAGLAAQRRTEGQLQAMRAALDDFAQSTQLGEDTVAHDFRFHLQIAQATGNRYFADIMNHLGTTLIPRTRVGTTRSSPPNDGYLQRVNREHEEIYMAIARKDAESARAAMRVHLTNSRERLRQAQEAAAAAAALPA